MVHNWKVSNVKSQFEICTKQTKEHYKSIDMERKWTGCQRKIWIAVVWIINKALLHLRNPVSKNVSHVETNKHQSGQWFGLFVPCFVSPSSEKAVNMKIPFGKMPNEHKIE